MTGRTINDIMLLKQVAYWGGFKMQLMVMQISVFGSFRDIQPDQERLIKLIEGLPGFIPGTSQHLNIDATSRKIEALQRIIMMNNTTGWRLEIQVDRINAIYVAGEAIANPNSKEALVATGIDCLKKCIDILNIERGFIRLAINGQYVKPMGKAIPEIPFTANLPNYIENIDEVSEWNLTLNKNGQVTINNDERTNEILSCSLGNAVTDPSEHAMIVTVDINTLQSNIVERFKISDMQAFSEYAMHRWDEMLSSI